MTQSVHGQGGAMRIIALYAAGYMGSPQKYPGEFIWGFPEVRTDFYRGGKGEK